MYTSGDVYKIEKIENGFLTQNYTGHKQLTIFHKDFLAVLDHLQRTYGAFERSLIDKEAAKKQV